MFFWPVQREIIFTALLSNIYVFIYFFLKYPNFFSTGYGILKLDVKTKSQSGVVSITVVTGCVLNLVSNVFLST